MYLQFLLKTEEEVKVKWVCLDWSGILKVRAMLIPRYDLFHETESKCLFSHVSYIRMNDFFKFKS